MKLTLAEPRFLKEPVLILSELVNEVNIKLDKDQIEIIAMDPANVAMVIFRLLSSAFVQYDVEKPTEIAVNLDNLKQILKRAKPSDTLTLELIENRLRIRLKSDSTRTFNLSLINLEEKKQKIPDLKFPLKIETSTALFDEAVEDMDVVSDSIALIAEPSKFSIEASGSLSNAKVDFSEDEDTKIDLAKGIVKSKYSTEYLKKIIKGSKLSDNVTLQFSKDYPLKIEYKIIDKLSLTTILAPRVSTD